ncbi:MAG TPA: POTRA domain-containing protein [Blastocatellia bacterium]|nr:POTRA domain-containing protein [Blastocatellia bacterium]
MSIINKCSVLSLLLLTSLLTFAPSGYGRQAADTKVWKLNKIEFSGLQRISESQAIPITGLQLGATVDEGALNAAMKRLEDTGFFKKVGYNYRYRGDQVDVTFQVEEMKWDLPVVFDNFVWFTDEEIHNAVRRLVPNFGGYAPRSGNVTTLITSALEQLLRERNIAGQVEYTPTYDDKVTVTTEKDHNFSVKGQKFQICRLRFPGATAVKESDLVRVSKPLMSLDYSRGYLNEFIYGNLIPFYRERGHLRARFHAPQARLEQGSDCKNGLDVAIEVEEGSAYAWDKAEWTGNEALSVNELEAILGMKSGDVANGLKVDNALKTIHTAYGKKGYISARAKAKESLDEAKRSVTYQISITEGPQYRMGDVTVTGVSESDANKLKEKWKLKPGDVFDASYPEDYMSNVLSKADKSRHYGISMKYDRENKIVNVAVAIKPKP